VAFGNATPGNVCPKANVITPVIVPPAFGSAALAVAWAATAALYAVLTAVDVAANVLLVKLIASESWTIPAEVTEATLLARPADVIAFVLFVPAITSLLVASVTPPA
jgi:hypothetical protein